MFSHCFKGKIYRFLFISIGSNQCYQMSLKQHFTNKLGSPSKATKMFLYPILTRIKQWSMPNEETVINFVPYVETNLHLTVRKIAIQQEMIG